MYLRDLEQDDSNDEHGSTMNALPLSRSETCEYRDNLFNTFTLVLICFKSFERFAYTTRSPLRMPVTQVNWVYSKTRKTEWWNPTPHAHSCTVVHVAPYKCFRKIYL